MGLCQLLRYWNTFDPVGKNPLSQIPKFPFNSVASLVVLCGHCWVLLPCPSRCVSPPLNPQWFRVSGYAQDSGPWTLVGKYLVPLCLSDLLGLWPLVLLARAPLESYLLGCMWEVECHLLVVKYFDWERKCSAFNFDRQDQFYKVVTPTSNKVWEFPLLHILAYTWTFQTLKFLIIWGV